MAIKAADVEVRSHELVPELKACHVLLEGMKGDISLSIAAGGLVSLFGATPAEYDPTSYSTGMAMGHPRLCQNELRAQECKVTEMPMSYEDLSYDYDMCVISLEEGI